MISSYGSFLPSKVRRYNYRYIRVHVQLYNRIVTFGSTSVRVHSVALYCPSKLQLFCFVPEHLFG
jgi:hypothetical protein